jgi:hypothetical protein
MIHLEYDVPTAGVRVSFVVRDETLPCAYPGEFEGVRNVGGTKHLPQNQHNLAIVSVLLEAAVLETQS